MKTSSLINARRMEMFQRMRFNPIRGMDPERLSTQIDQFHYGYLRDFALTMEAIENRDDKLKCVAPKRKKAVARNGWEVLTLDDSAEAKRQAEALTLGR